MNYSVPNDVQALLDQVETLRTSLNEQNKWIRVQAELLADTRKERDKALDALTVTQEEWLFRVKYLEKQLFDLKKNFNNT